MWRGAAGLGTLLGGHLVEVTGVFRLTAYSGHSLPLSFQVSKKYSEIEEFYQKLSARPAAASLPPLPRKVLFVGEADIRERRAMFDEILRRISEDAELASSPELLEFLGSPIVHPRGLPSLSALGWMR